MRCKLRFICLWTIETLCTGNNFETCQWLARIFHEKACARGLLGVPIVHVQSSSQSGIPRYLYQYMRTHTYDTQFVKLKMWIRKLRYGNSYLQIRAMILKHTYANIHIHRPLSSISIYKCTIQTLTAHTATCMHAYMHTNTPYALVTIIHISRTAYL